MNPAAPSRRGVIAGALGLTASPAWAGKPMAMVEVVDGAFVRRGVDAEANPANADAIANIGFIIGERSVLVVDPGGSLEDGEGLLRQVRARTALPVSHVVLSHAHPDHLFGAGAFVQEAPWFIGHARLEATLAARGAFDRARLVAMLGEARTGPIITPSVAVSAPLTVDLGGRTVRVVAHPPAHSSCDLSCQDDRTGLLFPSDLLFVGRVPALDGSLLGWLSELDRLTATGVRRAVPGHGPAVVDFPAAAARLRRYLTVLRDETRAAIAGGVTLPAAVKTVAMSQRAHWRLFDAYNGRNVIEAYRELEWE